MLWSQTVYNWTGANGVVWETGGNWASGTAPTIESGSGDAIFGSSQQSSIFLSSSVNINSLSFTGAYPHYYFVSSATSGTPSSIGIGSGGITLGGGQDKHVDVSSPNVRLNANQTWNTEGNLSIYTSISSTGNTVTLTKTGNGYLALGGASTFSGGLTVSSGALYLGSSTTNSDYIATANPALIAAGPVGLGALTMGSNTSLASLFGNDVTLANAINLSNNVRFDQPLIYDKVNMMAKLSLVLGGTVSALGTNTTVSIDPANRVNFAGLLSGPSNTIYTFTSGGAAIFSGSISNSVAGIVADSAKVYFASVSALPATSIQALNNGYVGILGAFDGDTSLQHPSPANVISKITSPGLFSGTLGFDSQPNSGGGNLFHGTINLAGFTNTGFYGLGTSTFASLASDAFITPTNSGAYKFGGGGGRLVVASDLNAEAGLTVQSPAATPLTLVLQGNNTFTGSVYVSHSYLILDSANPLPSGAHVTLGDSGYLGATENGTTTTITPSYLISKIDPTTTSATGILGFDSSGPATWSRVLTGDIDLTALFSGANNNTLPYLGTTTFGTTLTINGVFNGLVIQGNILVPVGQPLKLAGLNGGILQISSALTTTNGITSVIIGHPDPVMGAHGTVVLTGANNYAGGTTLLAGTLKMGVANLATASGSTVTGPAFSPIGTGPLVIDPAATNSALYTNDNVTLSNSIAINAPKLSVGSIEGKGSLTLNGSISGPGLLDIQNLVSLNNVNTYTGGTNIVDGTLNAGTGNALGSGGVYIHGSGQLNFSTSAAIGSLNPDYLFYANTGFSGLYGGTINLATESTLTINQAADGWFAGTITGSGARLTKTGTGTLTLQTETGNTYSGGTTIASGVLIANTGALGAGTVSINGGAGLGLNYGAMVTNQIVFNGSAGNRAFIGGFGTVAPTTGTLTIGNFAGISPGDKIDPSRIAVSVDSGNLVPPVGLLQFGASQTPISLSFASGGVYDWGIQSAGGTIGTGWDIVLVNGALAFTSSSTAPFKFRLSTFDGMGANGLLTDFNNSQSYSWMLLTAYSSATTQQQSLINGFSPANIVIDTSAFMNPLNGGSFSLAQSGSSLFLNFTPIPEPSTYALIAVGLGLMALLRRRRQ